MGALPSRTILEDPVAPGLQYEVVTEPCSNYNTRLILVNNLATTKQEMIKLLQMNCVLDKTRQKYIDMLNRITCLRDRHIEPIIPYYLPEKKLIVELLPRYNGSVAQVEVPRYFKIHGTYDLLIDTIEGIKILHELNIVNGNLKPSNILFKEDGHYVIGDYSRYLLPSPFIFKDCHYYSPELLKSNQYTIQSDIWSFGCIMYYVLSGKTPFNGEYYDELALAIIIGKYEPLKNDDFNTKFNELFSKIFIMNESDRISSERINQELIKLKNTHHEILIEPTPKSQITTTRSSRINSPSHNNGSNNKLQTQEKEPLLQGKLGQELLVLELQQQNNNNEATVPISLPRILNGNNNESTSHSSSSCNSSRSFTSQLVTLDSIKLLCQSNTPITEHMLLHSICSNDELIEDIINLYIETENEYYFFLFINLVWSFPSKKEMIIEGLNEADYSLHTILLKGAGKSYSLDLRDRKIENDGIEILSEYFNLIPNLKYLYLDNNNIAVDGVLYLRYNLSSVPELEYLSLKNNSIGDEGIEYLCEALQRINLLYLDLTNTGLTDEGIEPLRNYLKTAHSLQQIIIEANNIDRNSITSALSAECSNSEDIIVIGDVLKDLGYYFDEELHLRRLSSDKLATTANIPVDPFATVHDLLVNKYSCNEVVIPEYPDQQYPNAKLSVYCSKNYEKCETLLIIIPGTRTQAGIWSRSLCIDEGLNIGSVVPYVEKAIDAGYGVIVTNPNTNFVKAVNSEGNTMKIPIKFNETPENHLMYVYDKIITKSSCKSIVCVAYAYGGVIIKNLLRLRPECMNKIKSIAFLESQHTLTAELSLDEADSKQVCTFLEDKCINWKISPYRSGFRLEDEESRSGCICLSAGPDPTTTPNVAHITVLSINVVFQFFNGIINNQYKDALFYADSLIPCIDECPITPIQGKQVEDTPTATTPPRTLSILKSIPAPVINEEDTFPLPSQSWVPDNDVDDCQVCLKPFSFLVRKHHCRLCGRVVCAECSKNSMRLKGIPRAVRVCQPCYNDYLENKRKASQTLPFIQSPAQPKNESLSKNDFQLLKAIGKGSFGKVLLVRKLSDRRIYALKILNKAYVVERNQVEHTKTERKILEEIKHPFLCQLRFAFQTEGKLYLGMDFCAGGPLFYHLQQNRRFSEDRSRFYAAEVISGIGYLHSKNILYRDMKPENILLDRDGHIVITDFGLSKLGVDSNTSAQTICGTPEYVAPEVLLSKPYGKAIDWWSIGTLIFEMIAGIPPFYDKNRKTMFQKILHGKLVFPNDMSSNTRDIIEKLLQRDPALRLGSGPTDSEEVKAHQYFESIDWNLLEQKQITPPWKPLVTGETDTGNFNKKYTRIVPDDPSYQDDSGLPIPSFEGFTYDKSVDMTRGESETH